MWKYGDKYVIYRLKVHMIGYYRSADIKGPLLHIYKLSGLSLQSHSGSLAGHCAVPALRLVRIDTLIACRQHNLVVCTNSVHGKRVGKSARRKQTMVSLDTIGTS